MRNRWYIELLKGSYSDSSINIAVSKARGGQHMAMSLLFTIGKIYNLPSSLVSCQGGFLAILPTDITSSSKNIQDIIKKILEISEKEDLGIREDDIIIK